MSAKKYELTVVCRLIMSYVAAVVGSSMRWVSRSDLAPSAATPSTQTRSLLSTLQLMNVSRTISAQCVSRDFLWMKRRMKNLWLMLMHTLSDSRQPNDCQSNYIDDACIHVKTDWLYCIYWHWNYCSMFHRYLKLDVVQLKCDTIGLSTQLLMVTRPAHWFSSLSTVD